MRSVAKPDGAFRDRWLTADNNLLALADLSGQWIDRVHARRPPRGVILDMDSSVSPTHGEQENSVWNSHYGCTCYHPLFVFNQFGDLERWSLRPGNVHSADTTSLASTTKRGTCEQYIKEGKGAIKWTRLSWRSFAANAVRLQLHALAYNLSNFLRTLATPELIREWSLTTLKEKLIKIGAKVVCHARRVTFQSAEVAIPRELYAEILQLISELRPPPVARSGVMRSIATTGEVCLDVGEFGILQRSACHSPVATRFPPACRRRRLAGNRPSGHDWLEIEGHLANVGSYFSSV